MRCQFAILAIFGLALTGCGGSKKVAVFPVRGQIFCDGKPAAGVQVFFFPTAAPGVPEIPMNPRGETGPDGCFTLSTYVEGDGAAEGSYQLVLYWPEPDDGHEDENKDRLLGWYTVARTRIAVQVKPAANDLPPFHLPAMKVPPSQSGGGVPGRN
jgi:hypothetical protein